MAIQRDSKLGYGYLLVSIAMPPILDKFFGPTAGLCAYAICLLAGLLLLLGAHHDRIASRRSKRMTIFVFTAYGAVIGSLAGGLFGAIVHRQNPTTNYRSRSPT